MKHYLTIISDPTKFTISEEILSKIKSFLTQQQITLLNITTLSSNEAYDFEIEIIEFTSQQITQQISELLDGLPIDFFLIENSKKGVKKLFISDMDSTLIQNECIDEIARSIGKYQEVQKITEAAMSGDLLFENSLEERVKLLEGTSIETLNQVSKEQIHFSEGVETTVKTLNKLGVITAVASGGFTFFSSKIKEQLELDHDFANHLEISNNALTGKLIPPIYGSIDKVKSLESLIKTYNLTTKDCIAIGDGSNDIPMLQSIPFGICYHAKPIVKKSIEYNINHTGFTSILFIQGIKKENFASCNI